MFTALKVTHISTVVLTGTLFIVRWIWMRQGSPRLQHPFVRIAPHVNDTVLFLSAMGTAALLGQYPFVDHWLTAKFLALPVYIVLGHIALKRGRNQRQRLIAFIAAVLTFTYIVGVALCRAPLTCLATG